MTAERIFAGDALLGEGACFEPESDRLWWVDILGRRVFCGNPEDGQIRHWEVESEVGACLPMVDGRRALVLRNSVIAFTPDGGPQETLWHGDEPANNRFNDACIAPDGTLWITSMDFDAEAETGALWRVTGDGNAVCAESGFACLNGPAFSPDGGTLYLSDTMQGRVFAYDHDPRSGALRNRRIHIDLGRFGGLADGMTVDRAGTLWLAQLTVGRVGGYAPDGAHVATIPVPVPMPTSVAFGGGDLRTLYITTARIIADDCDLAAWPDSGSVYAVRMDEPGLPSPAWSAL